MTIYVEIFIRNTFCTSPVRRFDAYMIYTPQRDKIIDYLGTHQHLAVELDLSVDKGGGLRLRSGAQRFYEGMLGFRFPMLASATADVHEWFDDDTDRFRIDVSAHNPALGPVFGYSGWFDVEWQQIGMSAVPREILPHRIEAPV
jgi:hypothetical protein